MEFLRNCLKNDVKRLCTPACEREKTGEIFPEKFLLMHKISRPDFNQFCGNTDSNFFRGFCADV